MAFRAVATKTSMSSGVTTTCPSVNRRDTRRLPAIVGAGMVVTSRISSRPGRRLVRQRGGRVNRNNRITRPNRSVLDIFILGQDGHGAMRFRVPTQNGLLDLLQGG